MKFERKPQKYLKSGEKKRSYTTSGTILNSTRYRALPLIRLYGSGTLTVGDISLVLTTQNNYVDIDCELQEALQEGENNNITLTDGEFPYLDPGVTQVSFTGTSFDITPRWYSI